jgi:phage I-like protein
MSGRSASPSAALVLGVSTLAVTLADGKPPEWVHVLPRGELVARDGRRFQIDPEVLVARFQADGVDIAVDLDHALALRAPKGEAAPAQAWLRVLEARADGVWGQVDWLEGGKSVLAARTHRYLSPTFHHDENGRATWLHSVALVAAPAMAGTPALASALATAQLTTETETRPMKGIATALGLTEDASEQACLAALGTMKAGAVDKAVHEQTLASLSAATTELAGLKRKARDAEVETLLAGALKDRKILPAQKDHFAALCTTDEGLAGVRALLAASAAQLQASGLDGRDPPATDAIANLSAEAIAEKASAYRAKQATAGITLSIGEAVTAVKEGRT